MKRQLVIVSFCFLLVSGFAFGQGSVPQPQIIDHQILLETNPYHGAFTATENIQATGNLVVTSIICLAPNDAAACLAAAPTDGLGSTFTFIGRDSVPYDQGRKLIHETYWVAATPGYGTDLITFNTDFLSGQWNVLVEQIQGIGY